MKDSEIALIFKALADENRIKILKLLSGGELCACKILEDLSITQPTLSHHMKILSDCNLVKSRKDGKWSHYSLNYSELKEAKHFISEIECTKFKTNCTCSKEF